ncbi:hypothetical protein MJO28_013373 [Puccinia striiformis f. sp. tritici]|uniref:Uncharacterized protein n=3 Tax=Puccinia striiformis TaxID=27350 RepID=A0A2S4W298_9BASI|nr:hypothetical protein Pst134EB_024860 [Puccinia striiformis f. sp. tritici]KAI7941088.1 hypothetical protein MJO28_013373 [Puccinia striiformis f. sp. tritici]POW15894.1 hypothetical protein PSTT_01846 [Puccinia striiformis]POW19905.1 hypothetical protein PSHT_04042 [Puccinia striiformis]
MTDTAVGKLTDVARSMSMKRQKFWEQGDMILQGFRNLESKFDSGNDKRPYTMTAPGGLSIEKGSMRRKLLHRLHSRLLPILRYQVKRLLRLLDLTNLRKRTHIQFKLISELQLKIDPALDQIISAFHTISPQIVHERAKPNDQHFKELKNFRLRRLDFYVMDELFRELSGLFDESCDLIQRLRLSKEKQKFTRDVTVTSIRESLVKQAHLCCNLIESAIQWLKGSEFDIIQVDWRRDLDRIDTVINQLMVIIDPTIKSDDDDDEDEDDEDEDSSEEEQSSSEPTSDQSEPLSDWSGPLGDQSDLDEDDGQPPSEAPSDHSEFFSDPGEHLDDRIEYPSDWAGPLDEPVIHLTKLSIPIVKLSRLFFNKLSRGGMNIKQQFPKFTEMTSFQLDRLASSVDTAWDDLNQLLEILEDNDISYEPQTLCSTVIEIAHQLESHFESFLCLILLHFFPLIPDTDSVGDQNHFKNWFVIWKTQFTIAVYNLTAAVDLIQRPVW